MSIHERVRQYVCEHSLSQTLIARNMGISPAKLSRLLNGQRKMTVDDYEQLCYAMAVDPIYFLHDNRIPAKE